MSPIQRLENESKGTSPSRPRWINPTMWCQCQHLEALFPAYDLLCRSIINNSDQWEIFIACDDPYSVMKNPYRCEGKDALVAIFSINQKMMTMQF
jgi:hypothetical protein